MSDPRITQLVSEVGAGRPAAVEQLLPLVYDELRRVAEGIMRGRAGGGPRTLQPTALVNEVCVRLLGATDPKWNDRTHFFAVAAMAMRQVLASYARGRRADKRMPPGERITLSGVAEDQSEVDLLALDDALSKLALLDARQARVVELRYLAGLSAADVAQVMGISVPTVDREWRAARAFLRVELGAGGES